MYALLDGVKRYFSLFLLFGLHVFKKKTQEQSGEEGRGIKVRRNFETKKRT